MYQTIYHGVHILKALSPKAGKRLYALYQLKRAGVSQSDLLRVYLSVIDPVVEYACPVFTYQCTCQTAL